MNDRAFVHLSSPVRVVFEVGAVRKAADETRRLGRHALLISGRHAAEHADVVAGALGIDLAATIPEVAQHVPATVADDACALAQSVRADVVLSIGGGSATGLAKAVARRTAVPIVAVPTTYAGSEMTSIWGSTDERGKTTGRDPRVQPRTVIYDPALTIGLPGELTAASGMNALAHAVEGLRAPEASPVVTLLAEEGIRVLAAALPRCVRHPDDVDARADALYGAWLCGWVLESVRTGLHHRLAHLLGGMYALPHGAVHSALLPQVTAFHAEDSPQWLARAGQALGGVDAVDVAGALFDLAATIGAPTALESLGLPAAAIDEIADVVAGESPGADGDDRARLRRLVAAAHSGQRPSRPPTS